MSLSEGDRLIKPQQIMKQVPWDQLEGVIILGLSKKGDTNKLFMSSLTVEELAMLQTQLTAHVVHTFGAMKEE